MKVEAGTHEEKTISIDLGALRKKFVEQMPSSCHSWLTEYVQCSLRISSRMDGKGDCKGHFVELCQCQDHYVRHEFFLT